MFLLSVCELAKGKKRRQEQIAQPDTRQTKFHSIKVAEPRRRDNEGFGKWTADACQSLRVQAL